MCFRRLLAVCVLGAALVAATGTRGASPRFFPDDPLQVDDDRSIDASRVAPIEGSNGFDFTEHTFLKPGDRRAVRRATSTASTRCPTPVGSPTALAGGR
jgi:hypothetical protein